MRPLPTAALAALVGLASFGAVRHFGSTPAPETPRDLAPVTSQTGAGAVLALADFLPGATADERHRLAEHFAEHPLEPPYNEAVKVLLPPTPAVVASDMAPAVSLEPLLEIADPEKREEAIHAALVGMIDAGDPVGALLKASKVPGLSYWKAAGGAFNHWFSKEPEKAFASLNRIAEAGVGIGFARNALGSVARDDPTKAILYFEGISNPDARLVLGPQIAKEIAWNNPGFAAGWWSGLPKTEQSAGERRRGIGGFFRDLFN